jgi:hypothetical protein
MLRPHQRLASISGIVQSVLALLLQTQMLPRTLSTMIEAGYEPPWFTLLWQKAWALPFGVTLASVALAVVLNRLPADDPRRLRLTAIEWTLSLAATLLLAIGIIAMALPLMMPLEPRV